MDPWCSVDAGVGGCEANPLAASTMKPLCALDACGDGGERSNPCFSSSMYNHQKEEVLLSLTDVRTSLGLRTLEDKVAAVLLLSKDRISVVFDEIEGELNPCTIVVYPGKEDMNIGTDYYLDVRTKIQNALSSGQDDLTEHGSSFDSYHFDHALAYALVINTVIQQCDVDDWLGPSAKCFVAEEEEEVIIDEDEALRLWREQSDDARTSHLEPVPSPDGEMVLPTHDPLVSSSGSILQFSSSQSSAIETHLKRDPFLFELDNVPRVHVKDLGSVSWTTPVMITGIAFESSTAGPEDENVADCNKKFLLSREELTTKFGDVEVRTGNRNTLIENGFTNSKPMALKDALDFPSEGSSVDPEFSRIVFSPVKELPKQFQDHLAPFTNVFPSENEAPLSKALFPGCTSECDGVDVKKFTLCLAPAAGFGIGFHRHNAAMFLLMVGRKKWYMGPQSTEDDTPTHPGFYTTKSTHKCIQKPGEILYVPDQWYHEIFNLEYTAGIQALPD